MTPRFFKNLLTISWIAIIVGSIVDVAAEPWLPEPLQEYRLSQEPDFEADLTPKDWLMFGIAVPLLVAVIAAYVGMYKFKHWGRWLWLWSAVVCAPISPMFGYLVISNWASPFFTLVSVLYGVILALAYFSPVAKLFEENQIAAGAAGPEAEFDAGGAMDVTPPLS